MWNIIITVAVIVVMIKSCGIGDECKSYSDFTCKEIETADYNVYFFFPNGEKDYHLGKVKGLPACGDTAWDYATSKNLTSNKDWSYICCMIAKGSSCYEKHK